MSEIIHVRAIIWSKCNFPVETWNGRTRANAEVTYSGNLRRSLAKRYTSEFEMKLVEYCTIYFLNQVGVWLWPERSSCHISRAWGGGRSQFMAGSQPRGGVEKDIDFNTISISGDREGAENFGSRTEMWDFPGDGWSQVFLDSTVHFFCHIIFMHLGLPNWHIYVCFHANNLALQYFCGAKKKWYLHRKYQSPNVIVHWLKLILWSLSML